MKKKLVLHAVVKYFYPVAAGIETNMLETYSVLAKRGWDITIHTSKDTLTEKNALPDYEEIRGLKVKRYPFGLFGFWPEIDWNSQSLICLHNFNVFPQSQIIVNKIIRKLLGQKSPNIVLIPHGGYTPDWLIFNPLMATAKKIYHKTIGALLINHGVDTIRAVSAWERKEIESYGVKPNLVTVITNGIEDEAYTDVDKLASDAIKKKVNEYGKYIIQIGRIYGIKNYETTIRALVTVPKDIKFVIVGPVGDVNYLKELQNLIKELNLEGRVCFHGVVRGVDKYYLIKHAQLMVHMARWESFCNAVHEGMSQGIVCIVANNTALPLIVKNGVNGYLTETNDSVGLSKKINSVLETLESKEIKSIRQTNKASSLEESWSNVAIRLDKLYRQFI
jgi:glycosyltransferase involved in cell wall biosynthesis